MARNIVCCHGCGRDVDITNWKKIPPEIYCSVCSGRGKTAGPSDQRGRGFARSSEWFGGQVHEDDYSEESSSPKKRRGQ